MTRNERGETSGQAVIEYLLMLVTVAVIVGTIAYGFKSSILTLWQGFTQDITAACPRNCPPGNYKF